MEKQNFQEVVRGLANTLVDAAGHESHSKLSIKDAGSHSESLAMGGVTLGRTFSDYAAMCDLQGEDYTLTRLTEDWGRPVALQGLTGAYEAGREYLKGAGYSNGNSGTQAQDSVLGHRYHP